MLIKSVMQITVKLKNKLKNKIKIATEKATDTVKKASRKTIINTSAAMLAVTALLILPAGNLNFGYRVTCDGQTVGTVYKRSDALAAYSQAVEELADIESSRPAQDVKIILTIAKKDSFSSPSCLKNAVVAAYDGRVDCCGIFIDGALAAIVADENTAKGLLEEYKTAYKAANVVSVGFNKKVETKPIREVAEKTLSAADALKTLKAPEGGMINYTVKAGDTVSGIAEANGLTTEQLLKLNPGVSEDSIKEGAIINLSDPSPLLAVKTTSNVTEKVTVQYETEQVEDNTEYKGTTVTVRKGVTGEKKIEYSVVKENGVEISRKALKETVTKEPVSAMVKVGTKERPATDPTGVFKMPFYGVLTSRYGSARSRGTPHTGIDLAGPTGSTVVASDSGTVTFAGWNGSYGNLVKVKHSNGYETYYAHLSAINVSVGAKVAQGQKVGEVGSTGNSTGPHLHFEIRKDGNPQNPYNYLQ